MDDLTGKIISNYQILEKIGEGSHGVVYKATNPTLNHEVVVKVLASDHVKDPEIFKRFESEADVIAHLNGHPNIIPIYDYWADENGAYLVLKYLDGGTLRDLLNQHGALSLTQATYLLDKVASALHAAHSAGIVHRDLKPANIMFDTEGLVYLGDFGIAKRPDLKLTAPGTVLGTPAYLAPEQILAEQVTFRTDIYSLGIMLYECLTGQRPFRAKMAGQVMMQHLNNPVPHVQFDEPELSTRVNAVIQKATAKAPQDRYDSVLDMAGDFRRAIARQRQRTPPPDENR
ncbi:MAG: hypothetical protein OHK0046_16660 [Anaerolineae bacterium]